MQLQSINQNFSKFMLYKCPARVEDIKAGFAQIQVFIPTRFSCSPGEWGWSSIDTWWYHPVHVEILDI